MKKLVLMLLAGSLLSVSGYAQKSKSKPAFESGFEEPKRIWKGGSSECNPVISSVQVHSGKNSYEIGAAPKCNLNRGFPAVENGIVTIWFYDDTAVEGIAVAVLNNTENKENFFTGLRSKTSSSNYVVRYGKDFEATDVKRTTGWHEFKFVFSEKGCEYFIDSKSVKKVESTNQINSVRLGSVWSEVNTGGSVFFDDVKVEATK